MRTGIIYHKCEQGSESWHEIKLGRFTGTRIKNLMSTKSTASYQNVIAEVVAEILTHSKEDNYTNDDMQRGIDLEPEAADYYNGIFESCELEEVGFCEPEESDYSDYTGVSPDRLVNDDGLLEIKCPKAKTHFNYIKAGKMPNEYKWQIQHQLFITERKWCDFMSYYPGLKPFIIRVLPDLEMHSKIIDELRLAIKAVKETIEMYNQYNYLKD